MPVFREYKFLVLRRISQISIMLLFVAGNLFGWHILRGNLSTSRVLDTLTLTDPFALLQVFASRHLVSREALLGGLTIVIFFGLFAGRSFCSWVCPVNIVTDLANWLRKKTGLDAVSKSPVISRKTRYWVIGTSLVVSFFSGVAAFEWISPISMLHRGIVFGLGMGWTMILAVFLFDLFVKKEGFCGHLCPLGGFYSLITRFSLIRVRHNSEKCTLCMRCLEGCPEPQVLPMLGKASVPVKSGECTNCGRCVEVCNDNAMKFGIRYSAVKQ